MSEDGDAEVSYLPFWQVVVGISSLIFFVWLLFFYDPIVAGSGLAFAAVVIAGYEKFRRWRERRRLSKLWQKDEDEPGRMYA